MNMTPREKQLLDKPYLEWQERDELVASILRIATQTFNEMSATARLGAIINYMFWETNRVDLLLVGPGNVLCTVGGTKKYRGMGMAMPENAAAETLIVLIRQRPELLK